MLGRNRPRGGLPGRRPCGVDHRLRSCSSRSWRSHGLPGRGRGLRAPRHPGGALVQLVELDTGRSDPSVVNAFPRCVTREGNRPAQEAAVARLPARWADAMARHRARSPTATLRLTRRVGSRGRTPPLRPDRPGPARSSTQLPDLAACLSCAATSWPGSPDPTTAGSSGPSACRRAPWGPAWSRAKAPARSGTSTAAGRT